MRKAVLLVFRALDWSRLGMSLPLALLCALAVSASVATAAPIGPPTCAGKLVDILGTEGTDVLEGTPGPDVIDARGGDDLIDGLDGADTICLGAGSDSARADGGADRVFGGSERDEIRGGAGNDVIEAGDGDDRLEGDGGADDIFGDAGVDIILGGPGDDPWLGGGSERDLVVGGQGNDFVVGEEGNDALHGDEGRDELFGKEGNDEIDGGDGPDTIIGATGTDNVAGGAQEDMIMGGPEGDVLAGGSAGDDLDGEAGADTLTGEAGSDYIHGGAGADSLLGGGARDRLYADAGNDTCAGGSGPDACDGGAPTPPRRSKDPDICERDVEKRRSCRGPREEELAWTGTAGGAAIYRGEVREEFSATYRMTREGKNIYSGDGTVTWTLSGTDENGCTHTGSGSAPIHTLLVLDPRFDGYYHELTNLRTPEHDWEGTCPDGSEVGGSFRPLDWGSTEMGNYGGVESSDLLEGPHQPYQPGDRVLAGSRTYTADANTSDPEHISWQWSLTAEPE